MIGADAAEDVGQSFGSSDNPASTPSSHERWGCFQRVGGRSLLRISQPFLSLEKFSITLSGRPGVTANCTAHRQGLFLYCITVKNEEGVVGPVLIELCPKGKEGSVTGDADGELEMAERNCHGTATRISSTVPQRLIFA